MRIISIVIGTLEIPLIRPFITAVRQTSSVKDVVIMIHTDCGNVGYGSAASTPAITGDTTNSIIYAIENIIAPQLIGHDIHDFNQLIHLLHNSLQNNNSAKAAIDMALYDLFAQSCQLPLYKLLGGNVNQIKTCITISARDIGSMVADAKMFKELGFRTIKIKAGINHNDDLKKIEVIHNAIGDEIKIIIDANQGWNPKDAIKIINILEKQEINIVFIEQPVKAHDLQGLKFVRDNTNLTIIADESCFNVPDTLEIANKKISDGINIKLMKCGGIYNANAMYSIATNSHLKCMAGCMLESPIGVNAIAHFMAAKMDILYGDFDPLALIKYNPIQGGATIEKDVITLSEKYGLGIDGVIEGFTIINTVE